MFYLSSAEELTTANLMQTGFNSNQMKTAIDELTGAVIAFPDTLKFESLSDSLQETIKTGVGVGQFTELLGRSGINVDNFNKQLAKCSSISERQNYALSVLSKTGMSKISESYKKNNKDLLENEKSQLQFQDTMAKLGQSVLPIVSEITKTVSLLVNFLVDNKDIVIPIISAVGVMFLTWNIASMIQGIIAVVNGLTTSNALLNAVLNMNPIGIIITLIAGLVTAFIVLWNKCDAFREFWKDLWEGIKTVFIAVAEVFKKIFYSTGDFFKGIWDGMKEKVFNIINGIKSIISGFKDFFSNVWNGIKIVFSNVWNGFVNIAKAPINAILGMFNGLIRGINFIIGGINKISIDIPNWDFLPNSIQGKKLGFDIPKIKEVQYFAEGGIMLNPTMFGMSNNKPMIGGDAGAEGIIPLDKLPELMDKMGYIKPRDIQTKIDIDGREFAIVTSPYISQELVF